jgi:hypothetical protein
MPKAPSAHRRDGDAGDGERQSQSHDERGEREGDPAEGSMVRSRAQHGPEQRQGDEARAQPREQHDPRGHAIAAPQRSKTDARAPETDHGEAHRHDGDAEQERPGADRGAAPQRRLEPQRRGRGGQGGAERPGPDDPTETQEPRSRFAGRLGAGGLPSG